MTGRAMTAAVAAATAVIAIGSIGGARAGGGPLHRFTQSVQEYMTLRELALDALAPLDVTRDFAAVRRGVDARAAAIRRARMEARPGELFTPEVSAVLRKTIRNAVTVNGVPAASIDGSRDGRTPPPARVNGRFIWAAAVATPPCVLAVLPPLPDPLQYRFVGADLALVDTDADLIVDVLPDTLELAPTASR